MLVLCLNWVQGQHTWALVLVAQLGFMQACCREDATT